MKATLKKPPRATWNVHPQAVLDALPFQMAIVDKYGIIRQINAGWSAFAQENNSDMPTASGIGLDYLKACKGDRSPNGVKVVTGIQAVLSGRALEFSSEYPCHSKRKKRWFIMRVSPLASPYEGAVIAHFQITERVIAENALKKSRLSLVEARDAAVKSERSKSVFLSHMSHEFRTPLNGILGVLEMMKDSTLTPGQKALVDDLDEMADHLLGIVNDVLDLAKIEAGKLDLDIRPFDPGGIAQGVVEILGRIAAEKGLGISCKLDPDFPRTVYGDARRLRQVLFNLVGNAIKFTDTGSVVVSAKAAGGLLGDLHLEFSVKDTGKGIGPDSLPKLFHSFSQFESGEYGKLGGTGLGLAISRQLSQAMGGDIEVVSILGLGSEFKFRIVVLERAPKPDDEAGQEQATADWSASLYPYRAIRNDVESVKPADARKGTILVVDDLHLNRKIMSAILEKLGWSFILAKDGQEALDLLENTPVAALFLDCQMPGMDGYAAARAIREKEMAQGGPRMPIVAITADAMEENIRLCRNAGMDELLIKPFLRADVSRILSKLGMTSI